MFLLGALLSFCIALCLRLLQGSLLLYSLTLELFGGLFGGDGLLRFRGGFRGSLNSGARWDMFGCWLCYCRHQRQGDFSCDRHGAC